MADITMCPGTGCPLKDKCYRYTATPSELQSIFMVPPYKHGELCAQFWDNKDYKQKKEERCQKKQKLT